MSLSRWAHMKTIAPTMPERIATIASTRCLAALEYVDSGERVLVVGRVVATCPHRVDLEDDDGRMSSIDADAVIAIWPLTIDPGEALS